MAAISTKQSLPFLSQSLWHGWRRTPTYISHNYYSDDKKYFLSDHYFCFDNRTNNDKIDPRGGIETEQKIKKVAHFLKYLDPLIFIVLLRLEVR